MPVDALELSFATGLAVERNVPLGPYTSLKTGGPADLFVRARSAAELARCLEAAQARALPWLVVGGVSNLLVADRGFRGLAIKVEAPAGYRTQAEVLGERADGVWLRCEAGALTAGLARWTASLGWTGLEWACGIPGTIGGAAAGNAGAYGGEMAQIVERVRAWVAGGERVFETGELRYAYRTSRFKEGIDGPAAILSVDLRLQQGDAAQALARIQEYEGHRRAKQPAERSCGSVFKNPPGDFAGRLIEAAGLKGTAIGGAQISTKHANFFINRGDATAADVVALIRLARARVAEQLGVRLEIEILLAGDWSPEERAGL